MIFILIFFDTVLRLNFLIIPLFAWIFSVWALLAAGPVYIIMVLKLEDISFLPVDDIMQANLSHTGSVNNNSFEGRGPLSGLHI